MQGSHLISPCVWQSDVNRTLCCSENDQIGYKPSEYYQHLKFLKSATAIQAVWGSKCSIAVRPPKIYLGYMKIPRNWKWKCSRCAWWVAELIINHQCRNLSNNFYYIARPLELPELQKFCYPRRIRDFLRVSVEAPIHLLLLCPLFLFSDNICQWPITIMWHQRKMSRPDIACELFIGFAFECS